MSTGLLQGGTKKRVLRGKYTGEPGVISIPSVDVNKAHVNITSIPWTSSAGSTGSYKAVTGGADSITAYLVDGSSLEINNKIAYQQGTSASTQYKNVPVFWEVIEG